MTQASEQDLGCCGIPGIPPAGFFKALCDPTRMSILVTLAESAETRTVSQIAAHHPIDVSVVSRHLRALRDAEVLTAEKRGKEVHYSLNGAQVARILREFATVIENCPQCKGCC